MRIVWTSVVTVLTFAGVSSAATFTQLVDFGDSLSDVGNSYAISSTLGAFGVSPTPGGPGYSQGRFSNGNLWVQTLATKLGVAVPTYSNGTGTNNTNYAVGGSTSGAGNSNVFFPNLGSQVNSWTTSHVSTASQLFTVLSGANDLLGSLDRNDAQAARDTVAKSAAANVTAAVRSLYNDGARNVLVGNLPDLGLVPRFRGGSQQGDASSITGTFNTQLASGLAGLNTPGLNVYRLDLSGLIAAATANPSAFGLTNVTAAAYTGDPDYSGDGVRVADPSGYLFYDNIHPTTTGHTLVANAAFAAVPEPTGLAVLAVAGVLLRRRRAC